MSPAERRELVDRQHRHLSIVRQCQLMGGQPLQPLLPSQGDLTTGPVLDEGAGPPVPGNPFLRFQADEGFAGPAGHAGKPEAGAAAHKTYGTAGYLPAATHEPTGPERRVYPYLLSDLTITRANQVWAADITYLPVARGFLYLVAIMDWHSRYVVAWRLSNTLETDFCAEALGEVLSQGRPEVFNTDQRSQFTSREFTQILQDHSVKISMDGRGRYQDNILVERLWKTVKYEEVYLKAYANGLEARNGLREYFRFYNHRRPHQALGYRTPAEVFYGEPVAEELKERRCPDQPDWYHTEECRSPT